MLSIENKERFYLPLRNVQGANKFTYFHLGTVVRRRPGLSKTYMAFVDTRSQQCYIEELDNSGQLQFIEDDSEAGEIAAFMEEKGLLNPER